MVLRATIPIVVGLLLAAGCGRDERPATPGPGTEPPPTRPPTDQPPFEGTIGIVDRPRPGARVGTLVGVRTGVHANFDRVVFELEEAPIPGYALEYVDRPIRQCGSGEPTPVAGDGWLRVRLEPARAHTDEGRATITDRRRRLDYPNLRELVLTCDFEAQVEWVLGVGSPNPYRVVELDDPPRLVVDVRH